MHQHPHLLTGAGPSPSDRAGDDASLSSGAARRRMLPRVARPKLGVRALKPVTYSLMHLTVAIAVAYMLHEKAWSVGGKKNV